MDRFYPGSVVRVYARFRDPDTRLPAPVQEPVTIQVLPPPDEEGAASPLRNADPVVKVGDGIYFALFELDLVGTWVMRGQSSGETAAVDEGHFEVRPTAFG